MFKPNPFHTQTDLFSFVSSLPEAKQKKLKATKDYAFYEQIFCKINERPFAVLYSDKKSRPNIPINIIVGALILKEHRVWSYEELLGQVEFDLRTRIALGLSDFDQMPFCQATLFNFQNRLTAYYLKTGDDLLEQVFDHLTTDQIKTLGLKTGIQRSDSFLAGSNIRTYSRLQLLVEVLLRLHRILSDADQELLAEWFAPYLKQSSGQYIYQLKSTELKPGLDTLARVYHHLHQKLAPTYGNQAIFKIFDRVYTEHFTVVADKIEVKPSEELTSDSLQSPDDPDATYRHKRDDQSRGQAIHVTETAHPDNELNLLTDVAVATNNTDDSTILNDRLDRMMEKTPDVEELHTDGGYGSQDNDRKMEELGITHIQTAIKGQTAAVSLTIEQLDKTSYTVACPFQTVQSQPTKTRFKTCFDTIICTQCPLAEVCSSIKQKQCRTFYFDHDDYLRSKRHQAIELIPLERRKIRPNVEATVHEFSHRMRNGKVKVRGQAKTRMFAFLNAIGINFGRIFRYQRAHADPSAQKCKNNLLLACFGLIRSIKRKFHRFES